MDRAQRRARKALIRRRLLREFEKRVAGYRFWPASPLDSEELARNLRRVRRNEGKQYLHRYRWWADLFDKTYRACREAERMEQERRAWMAGENPDDPITEEELQRAACIPKRAKQPSESQRRRETRHCPVCLAKLPKNVRRTRLLRLCTTCWAHPAPHEHCRQCHAAAIWENRRWAACQACGLHGLKKDVVET